jgi:hypothetical protein
MQKLRKFPLTHKEVLRVDSQRSADQDEATNSTPDDPYKNVCKLPLWHSNSLDIILVHVRLRSKDRPMRSSSNLTHGTYLVTIRELQPRFKWLQNALAIQLDSGSKRSGTVLTEAFKDDGLSLPLHGPDRRYMLSICGPICRTKLGQLRVCYEKAFTDFPSVT